MKDIEDQLWKNNIAKGNRQNADFLNVAQEDFSKNKSVDFNGKEIIPSSFNIFRDSLGVAKEKLHETMMANLPEINLDASESESEAEEEVLPLDFNTAMLDQDNKIVIQAKPLTFKEDDEDETFEE